MHVKKYGTIGWDHCVWLNIFTICYKTFRAITYGYGQEDGNFYQEKTPDWDSSKVAQNSRPGTFHLSLCRSRDAPQPERIIKLQNAAVNRSLIQREVYLKPETRDLSACGKRSRETSKSPRRRFLIVHKFWRGSAKCCRCRVRTREMRSALLLFSAHPLAANISSFTPRREEEGVSIFTTSNPSKCKYYTALR